MAFYKSQYTGADIDQRLTQGTYDDAVKAGFEGTKDEFDKLLGQLKQISDLANNAAINKSDDLHTVNKNIVDAINEIHDELESKPNEQDVIDQGELQVFKDEIAAKYATKGEINDEIKDLNSKLATINNNLVDSVNSINKNVNDGFNTINTALFETNTTIVQEITDRKEADKELDTKIATVNQNTSEAINTINKNVADGFNTINGAIADEIRPNIQNNKTNIKQLQETVATLNTNLYQSIETINEAFTNAVNTINGGIATEISERKEADTELDTKLTQEISDRTQAIISLDSTLRNEISQRKNADVTLDSMIRQEISNRQTADTELSDRIDVLESAGFQNAEQIEATVDSKIEELVGAAPETLDTLKEIGDALNNDPDFAATITNELSKKADKTELDKKVDWVDYNNTKNIVLPSNGQIFGDFGGDESNSSLLGARIYNVGLENEEKQVEVGTSKVHLNLNSLDKPTIETPDGKENLVVESDIEVWAKSQDPTLIPSNKLDNHVVKYLDFSYIPSEESDPIERKTIQLNNYDSISGMNMEGNDAANLIMMSKWNKVDIGSSRYPVNLNGSEFTLNDNRNIAKVYETKALTDLAEGAADSTIRSALGLDFEDLMEIITDKNVIIVDRTSIGDYKTCIHASGNISGGNGAANLMFFIGTTPTIYQIQYVNGTYALAVNEYQFATKSDISNLATKDEIPEAYDDTQLRSELQQTETGVATANSEIEKLQSGKQSIQDETLQTTDKTIVGAINEILELIPIYVNIPIRSLKDQVYTQEEILAWFGVTDIAGLKNLFNGRRLIVLRYGIILTGNPMYYKIPIQYSAFESANQIKLVAIGLDTSNDVTSKYTIICNLDGTIIEGNSNVKLELTSLE